MNQWTNHADDPAAQPPADPAAAAAAGGQDPASLLQAQPGDWLPEKYRTFKDGTQDLDVEASARKLADAHKSLEQRMGQGGLLPKTAAEYKLENLGEGVNVDEVRNDPMFKGALERAHAAGVSQDAVQFFMQEYFTNIAPNLLAADAQLTRDEAKAELGKVAGWGDEAGFTKNLAAANRAFNGFAAQGDGVGSTARLIEKFGTDPDFLAFAAKVGAEMSEDTPITEGSQQATDWQTQVDTLRADPAYNDASNPLHAQKKQQMEALYQKRYGTKSTQLGGAAVR